jgi:predicted porin
MKNTLLTTTAIALTSVAGAASAVEISAGALSMNVSGYYTTNLGFASVSTGTTLAGTDFDGIDIQTNAEIWFKPSLTLDNGIKIGVDVQLEAGSNTNGDQIDESYMTIDGDFGRVIIGSENSAGYKMTVSAPDVSLIFANSSSLTSFIPYSSATAGADLFRGTLGSTFIENRRNNDAARISYFSPRFGGLQLGISYARDAGQTNGPVNNNAVTTDFVDIAANYSGSFGGVDVNASARYGTASAPAAGTDPEVWGAGLKIGFSGFSIGGSYAEQDGTGVGAGLGNQDGSAYDVGIGYANGPMSYSLTYFSGSNVDNVAFGEETLDTIVLAAKYKVASNFSVGAWIADVSFEDVAAPANNVDGTVVGVGASFSF